ncbi:MAG: DUF1848 family protein [Pseudomonadota bacterium]
MTLHPEPKHVLSASRRTDIPAFYLDWFMDHIKQGIFDVTNPYTRKTRQIKVTPERFHSIVFWSKNFDVFIQTRAGEKLVQKGFHLYFNFTINSESFILEPEIPPLRHRLDQLKRLSQSFGPRAISWRFDPICFYHTPDTALEQNNLSDFGKISDCAANLGIQTCVTSFFDHYKKIDHRLACLKQQKKIDLVFIQPFLEKKQAVVQRMANQLASKGICLHLCCEQDLFTTVKQTANIQENACIDGKRLKSMYGGNPETRRDYGQRSKQGCLCTKSVDIGSYALHPCFHNCLFCYASPDIDNTLKRTKIQ